MSKFRDLVEAKLKEFGLPSSYDYWRTTDPAYERQGQYEDWLENQDVATKYAVYVRNEDRYGQGCFLHGKRCRMARKSS